MTNNNQAAKPQPMPTAGRQNVLPEIIADLQARTEKGIRKYGTPLQTHNGRDALTDAYQEALDLSQYLKQELLERDSPGPVFNWPETVFARRNTLDQQLTHIISEMDEIDEAGPEISHALLIELADLHHSLETFWRILARKCGEDHVVGTFADVDRKNRRRGYYNLADDSGRVDHIEGPYGQMPHLED